MELADVDFVAVAQVGLVHAVLIDVGAVQGVSIGQDEAARVGDEEGVTAGDGDVVEVNV